MAQSRETYFSRRQFLASGVLLSSGLLFDWKFAIAADKPGDVLNKEALSFKYFPDKLQVFLWRNWNLVPLDQMAKAIQTQPEKLLEMGRKMGLNAPDTITKEQLQRSYLTIIRANWHLLPRAQLLQLLDWTDEKLEFTLQEDDFFYIKLGSLKPECDTIRFENISTHYLLKVREVLREEFPRGIPERGEKLFQFVKELSSNSAKKLPIKNTQQEGFSPRFGYSYFALFGDPLMEPEIDPFPEGYLTQMVASGMDSTWMHIVLSKLSPFPWDLEQSVHWEQRLENLKKLVSKARAKGIGIYLYLNEPRNLPQSFFSKYPDLKGINNGEYASLCTSHHEVQQYLVNSLATIIAEVPDLAGFFSITASENHTNCWSHGRGGECVRCSKRSPDTVIAELNNLYIQGIKKGLELHQTKSGRKFDKPGPELIVYDWGWKNDWAPNAIEKLSQESSLMCVSEWDLPIERGGVKSTIGEYSISAVGPGPRALRHWELARKRGLKTIAKIQAGNTWEIAAVPYIPAMQNVAQHAVNLRNAGVDGIMLGWTLGGYPSPNLEIVSAIGQDKTLSENAAMEKVAKHRYENAYPMVVQAWEQFSKAFSEYPFGGGLYLAPLQMGPANLLWEKPTGYAATMVGLPYDDLPGWAANYPHHTFIDQLKKVAEGFTLALDQLKSQTKTLKLTARAKKMLEGECAVAETVAIHFKSAANQAQFIVWRNLLDTQNNDNTRQQLIENLNNLLRDEIALAKRMYVLQLKDSRLGFEASNQYFYTPHDLLEKVLNCRDLIDRWLPELQSA
jgi:hypothetical protein